MASATSYSRFGAALLAIACVGNAVLVWQWTEPDLAVDVDRGAAGAGVCAA